MDRYDRYAGRGIKALQRNRIGMTAKNRIGVNPHQKPKITSKVLAYFIYLLTPESSIRTGFEKITHHRIDMEAGSRGMVKIACCIVLSISLASIIAKLV